MPGMSQFKNLHLELDAHSICTLSIDRPLKLNALNSETMHELEKAVQHIYDSRDIRGCIIIGSGEKAFVAGADIAELAELGELNGRKFAEKGQEVFTMIEECEKPVLAAINGYALGAGCELALACHLRLATSNALIGLPEVSLGIVPGYGGTQRLPQIIGKGRALEMILSAEKVTAFKAEQMGLLNYVCNSREELLSKAKSLLLRIFENAPLAVGMAIDCVNSHYSSEVNGYQTEANSFSNCCKTKDFKEGASAFLEKRKAVFKGQ